MKLKSTATKKKGFDKSKAVINLVNHGKLTPHLERAIGEGEFPWEYKFEGKQEDNAWHPSGHCIPTTQELYAFAQPRMHLDFSSEGFDNNNDNKPASLLKTFQVGHFWHQYLQWIVLNKLEFCDAASIERRGKNGWGRIPIPSGASLYDTPNVRYKPYHWATGQGDVAPCHIPTHGDYVVDFKTMGDHDYRQAGVPGWCANKYEAQIQIYMDFFDLDQGLIVAIQKGTPHELKEFPYKRNQPLIDAIYEKWHIVSDALDAGTPPELDVELPFMGPRE